MRVLVECCVDACRERRRDWRAGAQVFDLLGGAGVDCHLTMSAEPDVSACDLVHVFGGTDWPWAAWQVASASLQGKPVALWPLELPDMVPDDDSSPLEGEALVERGRALAAQAAMSLAAAVVAGSEQQRGALSDSPWVDPAIGWPRILVTVFPVDGEPGKAAQAAAGLVGMCTELVRAGPAGRERVHLGLAEVCDRLMEPGIAMMKRHHADELARERAEKDDLYRRFRRFTEMPVIKQYLAVRQRLAWRG